MKKLVYISGGIGGAKLAKGFYAHKEYRPINNC